MVIFDLHFCDLDVEVFIVVPFFELFDEYFEVGEGFEVDEDAALRVFGFGTEVDAYSLTVWNVTDLRHHLAELGRPCHPQGVRACGDEEVGVFQGLVR